MMRLLELLSCKRAERELDEELAFHIDMETRKNIAAGMNPEEAARAARLQFGTDPSAVKDYVRDTRRLSFLEEVQSRLDRAGDAVEFGHKNDVDGPCPDCSEESV